MRSAADETGHGTPVPWPAFGLGFFTTTFADNPFCSPQSLDANRWVCPSTPRRGRVATPTTSGRLDRIASLESNGPGQKQARDRSYRLKLQTEATDYYATTGNLSDGSVNTHLVTAPARSVACACLGLEGSRLWDCSGQPQTQSMGDRTRPQLRS